ncbi:transcriptional regulator FeaR [Pseudomonas cremoricolorata]|uniref:Transcriptional regulator n=1 Tax=Pseudomonas cremoricolorata TaxID=157783 RepID=A0A089WV24_9PSED|nr:transcriptional regulator FeaR [Pseudomonas cremoricolorata]AIR91059.1 transcriptional regulator [Pseudomonas cremoricolorata]
MHTQQLNHQGLERWTQAMQQICGRFETALAASHALFIGEVAAGSRAGLPVASLRTNAGRICRLGENPTLDDDQHCFLVSQRTGHSSVTQGGEQVMLMPGELLLMDSVGQCEIIPNGLIEHVSLALPREQVRQHLRPAAPLFGKISSVNTCGRMLHLLMDQLCKEGCSGEDAAQGQALQCALIALLDSALERNAESSPCRPGVVQGAQLRSYVEQVIDESLSQPGLTPASLAARLSISVRHLYRIFEEQGDSVCRYIQRARLKRSADDLANPCYRGDSITSIAYKWGFTDSAHFSRSFKKQFECSPKDFRAQALL